MGIRASKPLEILHADATQLSLKDNTRAFIDLVQDNFSRAILSFRCSLEHRVQFTFENLQYTFDHYLSPSKIEHCNLITDDGTENYGKLQSFLPNVKILKLLTLLLKRPLSIPIQ